MIRFHAFLGMAALAVALVVGGRAGERTVGPDLGVRRRRRRQPLQPHRPVSDLRERDPEDQPGRRDRLSRFGRLRPCDHLSLRLHHLRWGPAARYYHWRARVTSIDVDAVPRMMVVLSGLDLEGAGVAIRRRVRHGRPGALRPQLRDPGFHAERHRRSPKAVARPSRSRCTWTTPRLRTPASTCSTRFLPRPGSWFRRPERGLDLDQSQPDHGQYLRDHRCGANATGTVRGVVRDSVVATTPRTASPPALPAELSAWWWTTSP